MEPREPKKKDLKITWQCPFKGTYVSFIHAHVITYALHMHNQLLTK